MLSETSEGELQDDEPLDFRPDGAMLRLIAAPTIWLFCGLAFIFAMVMDPVELSKLTSGDYPQVLLRTWQASIWFFGAILTVVVGALRIGGAASRSAGELMVTLLIATGLMVACCWMSLRCGYLVTPTEIVYREGELWKPDRRLPLDGLVRVDPGCTVFHGKGDSYFPAMVVSFQSRVGWNEDTVKLSKLAQSSGMNLVIPAAAVDIGNFVDGRHLARWTEDMVKVSQLPQFRGAEWIRHTDAATAKCVDELIKPLDADHQAQLLGLLGYR